MKHPDYRAMSDSDLRIELRNQLRWASTPLSPEGQRENRRRARAIRQELGRRHRAAKARRRDAV